MQKKISMNKNHLSKVNIVFIHFETNLINSYL